jgi:hypothetical protein
MGSLDDAIRQHLELKRRLGASDEEIKEKETEAFGKGNRPMPSEPEAAAAEPAPELDAREEPFMDEDLAAAEPAANGDHSTVEWDPGELSPLRPTRTADEDFEPDEVPADEALTVRDERRLREELAAEPAAQPAEEDVLEETPEFLEETPEQDRLWFEQRPPKDFDFD